MTRNIPRQVYYVEYEERIEHTQPESVSESWEKREEFCGYTEEERQARIAELRQNPNVRKIREQGETWEDDKPGYRH